MSFDLKNEDGERVRKIYSCQECIYASTENHFRDTEEGLQCSLCKGDAEQIDTLTEHSGMPPHQWRNILDYLEREVEGVGTTTVLSLREHFEGEDFIEASIKSYDNRDFTEITAVDGIGDNTAEQIALGMAELKGWEDGLAESQFALSE